MSKGNVYANKRSVIFKGDGQRNIGGVPDVCKTPTPGGPVPTPYINIALISDLTKGTKKVRISGHPIAIAKSKLKTSMGDEPGTLGGIFSNKNKGKMAWATASPNVKAEGKGVVRFMDITMHNGNTYNTSFTQVGRVHVTPNAYGDDSKCKVCNEPPENHRAHESKKAEALCHKLVWRLTSRAMDVDERRQKLTDEMKVIDGKIKEKEQSYTKRFNDLGDQITANNENLQANGERDANGRLTPSAMQANGRANQPLKTQQKQIKAEKENDATIKPLRRKLKDKKKERDELTPKRVMQNYPAGYMVGVLICKCGKTKYASASKNITPEFARIARSMGMIVAKPEFLGETTPEYPGVVNPRMEMAKNNNDKATYNETRQKMTTQYKQLAAKAAAKAKDNGRGDPARGNCAGPRLVQTCLKNSHSVGWLSEKWFSPIDPKKEKVFQTRKERIQGGKKKYRYPKRAFKHGQTVTSCGTCRRELPPMLCDNKKHKCSKTKSKPQKLPGGTPAVNPSPVSGRRGGGA